MSSIVQDVRYSVRFFARNSGFTAFAILTLAIALGVNTAVFSVMYGVLLRALPYPESDQIVDVSVLLPPSEGRPSRKDYLDSQRFEAWQKTSRTVEQLAGYRTRLLTLSYSAAALLLLGITFFACYLPARRATRVQPVEALRYDG